MPDKAVEGQSGAEEKRRNLRAVIWFLALTQAIGWPYISLSLWYRCPSLEERTFRTFPALSTLIGLPQNWVPGICALLVTRFVLHEDWRTTTLNRLGRKRYYIWAWLLCPALALITVWLSVLLGRAKFDPSVIMAQVAGYDFAGIADADFRRAFLLRLVPVAVVMPAIFVPINMGEELGWRGFLLPRLMKAGLGQWEALLLTGAIWGFWHAPLLFSRCFGGPSYLGLLMTIGGSIVYGIVFGWLRLASGSAWVPAVAHATADTIVPQEVFLLAPGFNGYLVGYKGSLLDWAVYGVFIAWLAWTGRLPVRSTEVSELLGPLRQPEGQYAI